MTADLDVVKEIPFLESLAESELQALIPLLKRVRKAAGEIVFREGEPGVTVYLVRQGRVRFTFRHDTGEPDSFEEIGAGQLFGEVAVLTLHGLRTATATVTDTMEAYELTRNALLAFMREHPPAALYLVGIMAERLRRSGLQLQHTALRHVNVGAQEQLTARDRLAQWVARFAGSSPFLVLHAAFYTLWFIFNVLRGDKAPDPPPFHLLALIIGVEALILSSFVLMNQYRDDKAQARRNEAEFRINADAEKEVAYLHVRMDELHRELVTRLPEKKASARRTRTIKS